MSDDKFAEARLSSEEIKQFRTIRREEGLKIDPATAEVTWWYGQILDPYGIRPDLPAECDQVGRVYFAAAPDGNMWVEFGDLPEMTRDALWQRNRSELAFPAGLEGLDEVIRARQTASDG